MASHPQTLTRLIGKWTDGDAAAGELLFSTIHQELKRIASRRLRSGAARRSFQPTEIVNEAYLRLARQRKAHFANRHEFFAFAAMVINRAIVDVLRYAAKGGRRLDREQPVDQVSVADVPETFGDGDLLVTLRELDPALKALHEKFPRAHDVFVRVVFEERTLRDVAAELGMSEDAAGRKMKIAKPFLGKWLLARRSAVIADA
jgi:RNA polymerase sigma-70 factor, ECF subfamily